MSEYKYYLKKPKGEIVKDILLWLALGGMVAVAATSPTFLYNTLCALHKEKKYRKRSVCNAFDRLRREESIVFKTYNHQLYIFLTDEGKKKAGRFQIDSLAIKKPKRWDDMWRIVIFDIPNKQRVKREALRGFLRRLDLYKLQESVWVHPFNCSDEVALLRNFFGFSMQELRLLTVKTLEGDDFLRKHFQLYK